MPIPFSPSAEQAIIIDAFLDGHDIAVQAGAGTGKSTTLAFIAQSQLQHRPGASARYMTFNKRNAVEVDAMFAEYGLTNAKASTAHSLAYRGCLADPSLKHMVTNMKRAPMQLKAEMALLGIAEDSLCLHAKVDYDAETKTYNDVCLPSRPLPFPAQRRYLTLARDTVTRFCQSADAQVTARHVPYLGELEPKLRPLVRDHLIETAQRMWDELASPTGRLKTGHAHYLKAWALSRPQVGSPGDVILYDEAQDASPVLADVVLSQRGRVQLVLVGDEYQSLYGFTGAVDAMQGFQKEPGVITLPLTECRRFGPSIAEVANQVLDRLDPDHESPMRLRGIGPEHGRVLTAFGRAETSTVDAVVCATNGQVIAAIIDQDAGGRTVHSTLDIGELVSLANDVALVERGCASEAKEPSLRRFTDLDTWQQWLSEPEAADAMLHSQVQIVHRYGRDELRAVADRVVSDPDDADVTVSTIHKAKGGTWNRVQVAMGEQLISDEDTAKLRMLYVAATRARELVLVPPNLLETVRTEEPAAA
ncbi:AAA family ATPase [Mycobacterium koreense]|uniref:Uncharacterized protein n=1 Tax=Mycolicibacillus koreensis TaxID=1069220 RepID=A0A7I7SAZ7_9MYCO|nr:ATP-binding domain-containing protein [Mycolicibacillus koreensis]MCV7247677.1 AAA family ATPase [Mycolicibacillus koreensis]OSC34787.1 hypothetical protein B8W67_05940 [Mycolicibacillus koreensis]BBY54062.1 DNA helicase [Mycolicibacillus koreensis]